MTESTQTIDRPQQLQPKSGLLRTIAQGSGSAIFMRIGGMALLFVVQVVLTRLLGLQGYGEFAYALSWANTLAFIATLGMDRASLRFVAHYRTTGEHTLLRGFIRRGIEVGAVGTVPAILVMVATALVMRGRMSDSQFHALLAASLIIPLVAQGAISDAVLLALGRIGQGQVSNILRPALVIVLMLAISHFSALAHSATLALLVYLIASAACWIAASGFIKHWLHHADIGPDKSYETRGWIAAAVPLMLVVLLNFMQNQSGIILSGLFLGPKQAGLFAAASRISEAVLFGFNSINAVAAPTFAEMHIKGDHSQLRRFVWLCAWGSTAVTFLALVPLLFFGRSLMHLFGHEFVAAYPVLMILMLNPIIMSVAGSVNYLLNMTGHQNLCLKVFAVTTGIYLLLCIPLIPLWGIKGIAVSNVVTTAMWNIVLLYYVRKRLGIWSCIGKL